MAEQETEEKDVTPITSKPIKRRCRIPKLNRSSSVKVNGEIPEDYEDLRPLSLILPSERAHHWAMRYKNNGSVSSFNMNGDDDQSSVKSFGSFMSYTSYASQNTEASLSRPTSRTRSKRYVLHCERHLAPTEEYLTPTQRKDKEIRHLKSSLMRKTKECEEREAEVLRLKSEIDRLHEVLSQVGNHKNEMQSSQESDQLESLNVKTSPSEISFQSNETDKSLHQNALVLRNDDSGISNDMSASPRNSGEFDEIEAPRRVSTSDKESSTDPTLLNGSSDSLDNIPNSAYESLPKTSQRYHQNCDLRAEEVHSKETSQSISAVQVLPLVTETASRIPEDLKKFLHTCQSDIAQLKAEQNEQYQSLEKKVDNQVQGIELKLEETTTRYLELMPALNHAKDKILSLENKLGTIQRDMASQEDWHNQMYLKMYRKGQEAARLEQSDESSESTQRTPNKRVSVPELLRQLHQLETELDQTKQLYREAARAMGDRQAEYTLRFLKDAVFYFLTKKDKEHLKAIQSILGFTEAERMAVSKAMKHRRL